MALRGMGSVTVLNYMPTDPKVDAVGCLSRGGNCRHGAPPFELQGRPRDKPITANARTKTANARPLNPFASNKRMAARASHTSSPFPRHLRNAQTVSRVPDLLRLKAPTENPAPANLKDPRLKTAPLMELSSCRMTVVDPNAMTAMWERDYHLADLDSKGFLPSAGRARRRTGTGIASTCAETGSQGRLGQTAVAMTRHQPRTVEPPLLLRVQDLARSASARHKQLRANLLASCSGRPI